MASEKRANDQDIGGEYTDASIKRHRGENPGSSDEKEVPCNTTTSKPSSPSANAGFADSATSSRDSRPVSPPASLIHPELPKKQSVFAPPQSDAIGTTADASEVEARLPMTTAGSENEPTLDVSASSASLGPKSPEMPKPVTNASSPKLLSNSTNDTGSTAPSTSISTHNGDDDAHRAPNEANDSREAKTAETGNPEESLASDAEDAPTSTVDGFQPQVSSETLPELKAGLSVESSTKPLSEGLEKPPTNTNKDPFTESLVGSARESTPKDLSDRPADGALKESVEEPVKEPAEEPIKETVGRTVKETGEETGTGTANVPRVNPDNADQSGKPAFEANSETQPSGSDARTSRSESPIDVDMVIGALNNPDCGAEVMKAHANAITAHQQVQAYAKLAGSGWTYYVQKLQVVIGRNAADSTETVDIDLAPSKIVSRKHAVIHYNLAARVWEVFTVGRNGIRIDNTVVRRGSTAPLKSGTVIDAGNMQMMFVLPDAEPEVSPLYVQRLRSRQSGTTASDSNNNLRRADDQDSSRPSTSHPAPSYPRGVTILSQPPVSAAENFMNELSRDECRDIKPPFSYATMIAQSILSTPEHKMTLADIYGWISSHYAFYRHSKPGWQNSIRHNLSLNKAFEKAARKENEPGKGSKWFIVDQYKDELIRKATTGQEQRGVYTPRQPFDALPHPTNRGTHSTTPRAAHQLPQTFTKPPGKNSASTNQPLKRVTGAAGKTQGPSQPQPQLQPQPQSHLPPPSSHSQPSSQLLPLPQGSHPSSQPAAAPGYPQNMPLAHSSSGNPVPMPATGALNYGPPETPVGNNNMMHPNLTATNLANNNVPSPPLPSQPGPYGYPYMTPYGIQYFHPQTGQLLSPQHAPMLTNPQMPHLPPQMPPQMAPQMAYGMPESVNNEYNSPRMPLPQPSPDSRNDQPESLRNGQYHPMVYPVTHNGNGLPPQYSAAPSAHLHTGLQAGVELASERRGSAHPQPHEPSINADGEQTSTRNHLSQSGLPSPRPNELHTPARRNPAGHAELRGHPEYAEPAIGSGLLDSAIKLPPNPTTGMPESSPALWKYMNLESTPNRASPTRNNADERAHNNAPDSSPAAQHATNHNITGSLPLMDKWEGSKA